MKHQKKGQETKKSKTRKTVTVPQYYRQFQCAGAACPETCCRGWDICVDPETMKKYRTLKRGGFDFRGGIDFLRGRIRMKEEICPFLEKGLCRIHRDLGETCLCRTCRSYPRHAEDYGGRREWSLSLSCPEAAALILKSSDGIKLQEYVLEEGREDQLLSCLLTARALMFSFLSERTYPLRYRLTMILALAHDLQPFVKRAFQEEDNRESFRHIKERLKRYELLQTPSGYQWFLKKISNWENRPEERYDSMAGFLGIFGELPEIYPGFGTMISEWMDGLYRTENGYEDYRKLTAGAGFGSGDRESSGLVLLYENLAASLLYVYVPGAMYDGDLHSKVKLVLFFVLCLREAYLASVALGGKPGEALFIKLTSRFCRQIEHSDEVLEQIERAAREQRSFRQEVFLINLLN